MQVVPKASWVSTILVTRSHDYPAYYVILFPIFRGLRFYLWREDDGSTENMTSGH